MTIPKIILFFLITGIFSFANVTFAQDKDDDLRGKIHKIKIDKLIKRLELDSITAVTFKEKYLKYAKDIREVNKKRINVYIEIARNLESGEGLDTLVDKLIKLEKQINELKADFTAELRAMLTPKQFATMIIFERNFTNEIRKLLKEHKKDK